MKRLVAIFMLSCLIGGFAPDVIFAENLQLTKVSEFGTGQYQDVFVVGNYAYCTATGEGFVVLDISEADYIHKSR